jgi:hypothetical protein
MKEGFDSVSNKELIRFFGYVMLVCTEIKNEEMKKIVRPSTLNPACHPCPQYGRRASGRGEL